MRTIEEIKNETLGILDRVKSIEAEDIKESDLQALVGLESELIHTIARDIWTDRLLEICNAERDGRCVVLPCKVGSKIFVIPSKTNYNLNKIYHPENNRVHEQVVESISWHSNDRYLVRTCSGNCESLSDDLGVAWFLSREAAEAALKGEGNEERR